MATFFSVNSNRFLIGREKRGVMEIDKESLDWLEYNLLEQYPHVIHGSFGRSGGVSGAPVKASKSSRNNSAQVKECTFSSLNLGEGTSDRLDRIHANREIVRSALGIDKILFPRQLHGSSVQRVTAKNQDIQPQADALYTTEKNIGLAVTHADCQAAIFYDPVHEAIGVAHCGWKGSVQNIYARLIDSMQREIGTKPHHLIVCISPSLGSCCAEFVNYKQELPKDFWNFKGTKPHHFDLMEISRWQLGKSGVLDKNIEFASDESSDQDSDSDSICTKCNPNYFSYRRDKEMAGRNATIVALKH